ncbi:hypothetical protein C4K12_2967 [Pseudomonas chlororaphis subsp. aureofaciens]|nr:hypothetical protein C4K12_2967 [Pseudomonas chlororaphis subsp. aureofaciens]
MQGSSTTLLRDDPTVHDALPLQREKPCIALLTSYLEIR